MKNVTIAIDAMGGENAPKKNIQGIKLFIDNNKNKNDFIFHIFGDEKKILHEIKKNKISDTFFKIFHTTAVVSDNETPLTAIKSSKNSSMWKAISSQNETGADISLSAGNTGVLLVTSRMILKMIENVNKPALAGLWPNKNGMNVVLDLGANVECNEKNLVDFSIMGSALHKSLFPNEESKVAILNIGSEEIKGNVIIKKTYQELSAKQNKLFKFYGYIEGNQLMDGNVNVIITDGFTGNIALKTAEGTANFITSELKKAFTKNIIGKFTSLLNIKNLREFRNKLDPRLYNGAILLGLESPVIKSHGGTDYIGFANSLNVCEKVVKGNLIKKISENIL